MNDWVFLVPFIPVPTIILTARQGISYGLGFSILLSILIAIFFAPIQGISIFLISCSVGISQGIIINKKKGLTLAIILGAIGLTITFLFNIYITKQYLGIDIIKHQIGIINNTINLNEQAYLKTKYLSAQEIAASFSQIRSFIVMLPMLVPAIFGLSATIISFLSLIIARKILSIFGLNVDRLPTFQQWDMPWFFSWGYVLGIATQLFSEYIKYKPALVIGNNLYIFFWFLFVVQGFAVLSFFIAKSKYKILLIFFLITLLIVFAPILQLISWIGLFDVWFNYRRIGRENEQ